jgi:hypothetical protein
VRLVVLTAPREPSYLHATLGSAFLADRRAHDLTGVDILLDSREVRCVTPVRHHRIVALHRLSAEDAVRQRDSSTFHRITCNFHRALVLAPDEEDVVIIEDDLRFRDDWISTLEKAMTAARGQAERFVLAGYCSYGEEDLVALPQTDSGRPLIAGYPHGMFYGNQMLYVPLSVRSEVAEYVRAYGVVADTEPADLLVRDFCHRAQVPIFAVMPSLVQHVGGITSVSESKSLGHMSPTWEWPS